MTDRPIIFSAPMIQALLAGRKTQTRRLAWRPSEPTTRGARPSGRYCDDGSEQWEAPSPWQRVKPGDRLWVREAVRFPAGADESEPQKYGPVYYEASQRWFLNYSCAKGRLGPAIHMPRWASRLTLTVTAVRLERVQEISEEDALAEGMEATICPPRGPGAPGMRTRFAALWDILHGPGAWAANPEVVVIGFTVRHRNIDQAGGQG